MPLAGYGHEAVIAFFVLSGYVIAYVSTVRETDLFSFVNSRASRIYSVAVPALIVTIAIDIFVMAKSSTSLSHNYQFAQPWKYVPLFLVFGTDWWFLNEDAFSNVPYWSLCYEIWYYVLFAAWVYFRGQKRLVLCGAILILVGPRLWLLLPIWLSGVWLYHFTTRSILPSTIARAGWALSLAVLLVLFATRFYAVPSDALYHIIGQELRHWLRYSQFFLGDYLLAVFLVISIAALNSCNFEFGSAKKLIHYLAGLTFALYLFHYPLLELFASWLGPVPLALTVLIGVWGLSIGTDWLRTSMRSSLSAAFAPRAARSV